MTLVVQAETLTYMVILIIFCFYPCWSSWYKICSIFLLFSFAKQNEYFGDVPDLLLLVEFLVFIEVQFNSKYTSINKEQQRESFNNPLKWLNFM